MESISELKNQQAEAVARCEVAQSSIEVAQKRLDDVLKASRDTGKAREVLKKCNQLAKEAESQRSQLEAKINAYYEALVDSRAKEIVGGINANIAALLAPFDLTKYLETETC